MLDDLGNGYVDVADNAFGYVYRCFMPPVGYGLNCANGLVQETDILLNSEIPTEQVWERPSLPLDYKIRRNKEKQVQRIDPLYVDPYLEEIRKREWKRRLLGVWFWNYNPIEKESKLEYITGLNYFYITYWKFQGKFMDFRIEDMRFFYYVAFCMEDDRCLGTNELTKRKNGKCFGKNTPIRMFDGGVKMVQDIMDGEYVMGDDSTKRLVSGVVNGTEKMYRIEANKGESFECNESHILHLKWNGLSKPNYKGWKKGDKINISVKDYLKLKDWEKAHLVMYRVGWGNHFEKVEHIIPSYMLGVYLGDGSNHGGAITSIDDEIIDFVKIFAEKLNLKLSVTEKITYRLAQKGEKSKKDGISMKNWSINPYKAELRRLNVMNNKHIPKEYLLDSLENRIELLAGIIDTDGYLCKNINGIHNSYEITQKNNQLAIDVCELARGLGFFASIKSKIATMKRNDGSIYRCKVFRVNIFGAIHTIPSKVERKKCKEIKRRKDSLSFGFKVIDIGVGDYYGFTVDKNNLFLLSDGTVVHNTARAGCWGYERTSRLNFHHGGLQSKSDDDAEEAFRKAIIHPWQKLPDFFRPRHDLMKGEEPSELRFFATARRGSKAELDDDSTEEALESFFDYKPSTESAYDGPELHTYISDEAGKTKKPVSIKERQNVVRFCTEIDFVMKGKHYYTTTVEPDKGEEENYEFQEMTANSNPLERDENGMTGTGLYTYFLPAQKGMYINKEYAKYGYADEEMNLTFLNNKIKALEEKGDTRGISSFKRKNPRTFKEAFSVDGENSLYDPELLQEQLDIISWGESRTERGDLKWKDGHKVTRPKQGINGDIEQVINTVYWEANPKGRWEKVIGWQPKEPNNVYERNGKFFPNGNYANRIGCDPFKYDKTKDKRRSQCAAFNYQIEDELNPDDIYNDMFTLKYSFRADSTHEANEDMLMMAWYCGCQVLFERNVNHWKSDFTLWNCHGFLMYLPGEDEPGVYTDGTGNTTQTICRYTEAYINRFIKKVFFKTLIRKVTGWLDFKVEETQKYDEPMSAGFTLIAVKGVRQKKRQETNRDIESILPYHKIA